MKQDNQSELAIIVSPDTSQGWALDRDKVIEAVRQVAKTRQINRNPEEYFDDSTLRTGISDALGDPDFPKYYQAYENYEMFRSEHPEMVHDFESPKTTDDLVELMNRYTMSDPVYRRFKDLSDLKSIAMLKLNVKMVGAGVLDISAAYVNLANIIFPELDRSKKF
jgi:hypothetical protein